MNVNRFQFDSIVSKTKKIVTPILHGEENGLYFEYLALIELRLHDFHSKYHITGRQAQEILQLVLYDIKSVVEQEDYDCSKWLESRYRECADSIEELFLPEKNPEIKKYLAENVIEDDDFFEFARKIIIRIHESVEFWTKKFGSGGYFNFINEYINDEIASTKKFLIEDRFLNI